MVLTEQITDLAHKNEDLVDLIRILDEKMSKFEQYILENVDNGEEELHKLIHTSARPSREDDEDPDGLEDSI